MNDHSPRTDSLSADHQPWRWPRLLVIATAAVILALMSAGKYLEARAKGRTGAAIRKLLDLAPKTARVLRDGVDE